MDWSVLQIKTKMVSCHTADSKPVKQEVNSLVILPPLVFPGSTNYASTAWQILNFFNLNITLYQHVMGIHIVYT